ncbi:hypothetical protein [Burkholderia sp. Ac-20353]|uniref:hypothetical protein n=1 Tax=Burkholderia sp. Ac-20353 TaxID=2703894 RepID=UPI00197B8DE0|nr:hypothetical protein [Burkholderia sp. Ac-20353]MBN3785698.1 hypothetical protein [Burkholderia sp. Ac-20353]
MEDFAYLCAESNAAWLSGRGDGRFERYERFYQDERARLADGFDLEQINEAYEASATNRRPQPLALLSAPWVGKVATALFCLYMAGRLVPEMTAQAPGATGVALVTAFVGLRIFHRKHRKAWQR